MPFSIFNLVIERQNELLELWSQAIAPDSYRAPETTINAIERVKACLKGNEHFYAPADNGSCTRLLTWARRTKAQIRQNSMIGPTYHPGSDTISMPPRMNANCFYHTYETALLHELAHWSGARGRLNRKLFGIVLFDDHSPKELEAAYASEEIIAELASAQLACDFRVGWSATNSAEYVKYWGQKTKDTIDDLTPEVKKAVAYLKQWRF